MITTAGNKKQSSLLNQEEYTLSWDQLYRGAKVEPLELFLCTKLLLNPQHTHSLDNFSINLQLFIERNQVRGRQKLAMAWVISYTCIRLVSNINYELHWCSCLRTKLMCLFCSGTHFVWPNYSIPMVVHYPSGIIIRYSFG